MTRIPDSELERLKREVALAELVAARGIALEVRGKDLVGRCPWHEDDTPSLVVSPARNLWHCLGACQAGGSVIDWVMRAEGVGFREAVAWLQARHPDGQGQSPGSSPVLELDLEASDAELLAGVARYYHAVLQTHEGARGYLASRGLTDPRMIEHFRLGVADRTLGPQILKTTKAGRALRERLQGLGVLRENGREHLRGCLVIPIIDRDGRVRGLYGRKLRRSQRPGSPQHLYLVGPHRGVFNEAGLTGAREVILCEALIDALTIYQAGYVNVTASYGTAGFTADHLRCFKELGVERVRIAYDRDEAGDAAAAKLAERLIAEGIGCFRVRFPKGMDANEYALKVTPAARSIGVLLEGAEWLGGPPQAAAPPSACRPVSPHQAPAATPPSMPAPSPPSAASIAAPSAALMTTPSDAPTVPVLSAVEVAAHQVVVRQGDRRYRVRGLERNLSYDALKVNLLARREGAQGFHVDTLNLYAARQRAAFEAQAAAELGVTEEVIHKDLGRLLIELEALQDQQIQEATRPKTPTVVMSEEARAEALALLRDPRLIERIERDLTAAGLVGETTNKLMGYLAATSRKLERPLAVIVQASSSAGKSSLMEAVLACMPAEEVVKYSAMTGQSLFYMQETDLAHKILAIVEEEGAERASYALKLLQSEGELTIASTGKDPSSGRLVTQEYRVEGPVMIFLTTTAIEIDEELLNRCLVLTVSEEREQTRAIHELQRARETLDGLVAERAARSIRRRHQDAQRLLRPLLVANPYAERLTFIDTSPRTRRDHMKYLTLIRTIALLHQYQREVRTIRRGAEELGYIEVTLADIALANRLAHEVLGRTLDELPPVTRRLLVAIHGMVAGICQAEGLEPAQVSFTRRDVRAHTGWGNTQLKCHLGRLEEMEYLLVRAGGGRGSRYVYELAWEPPAEAGPHLPGLIDVATLGGAYDAKKSGQIREKSGGGGEKSAPGRGQVGPKSGVCRPPDDDPEARVNGERSRWLRAEAENALLGGIDPELDLDHKLASCSPISAAEMAAERGR